MASAPNATAHSQERLVQTLTQSLEDSQCRCRERVQLRQEPDTTNQSQMQPSLDGSPRRYQVLLRVVITPAIAMATAELKGSKAPAQSELDCMNNGHR